MKTMILFLFLIVNFSPFALAQDSSVGLIKKSAGQVLILRDKSQVPGKKGDHIYKFDRVKTGVDGSVGIVFTDGTTIAVGPETEFNIQDYLYDPNASAYAFSLYLEKGAAIYNSGKIGKLAPQAVKLNTPQATVGIRGTRVILEVK